MRRDERPAPLFCEVTPEIVCTFGIARARVPVAAGRYTRVVAAHEVRCALVIRRTESTLHGSGHTDASASGPFHLTSAVETFRIRAARRALVALAEVHACARFRHDGSRQHALFDFFQRIETVGGCVRVELRLHRECEQPFGHGLFQHARVTVQIEVRVPPELSSSIELLARDAPATWKR